MASKSNHYINNADFLTALKEYKQRVKDAEESGDPRPQVTNYLGECILKIATHLAYKPNFINYSYRDEMVSDGIENALTYIDNFNPEKSSNPFAYFTQIIYYAFIRRIHKEKKQTLIKGKIILDMPFDAFEVQDHDDGSYSSSYVDFLQTQGVFDEIITNAENKKAAKKKAKQTQLDEFLEDE